MSGKKKKQFLKCVRTKEEDAKLLVRDAMSAGNMNDLGSGSNVDLCVIRKNGTEYIQPFESSNYRCER